MSEKALSPQSSESHLGQVKKGVNDPKFSLEDTLINSLESVCSFFDHIYFAKSLGIISEQNFLYRKLNKGDWGSKLWFITLLLSARKSFSKLIKVVKGRTKLRNEISLIDKNDKGLTNEVLREKFSAMLKKSNLMLRDIVFDLFQTIVYLAIVVVDVFKIGLSKKWRQVLEPLSNLMTILKMFTVGFSTTLET